MKAMNLKIQPLVTFAPIPSTSDWSVERNDSEGYWTVAPVSAAAKQYLVERYGDAAVSINFTTSGLYLFDARMEEMGMTVG